MRERILKCFEPIIGYIPTEDDEFHLLCDRLDLLSVVMNCEKEFNLEQIDCDTKDEFDFNEVKDFVDWIIEFVDKQNKN